MGDLNETFFAQDVYKRDKLYFILALKIRAEFIFVHDFYCLRNRSYINKEKSFMLLI